MWGQGSATRGRAALPCALVLLALAFTPAPAAAATSAANQIAALNAQREANGIPAGIVEVPEWSDACRRHMAYIAANGGVLTHEENPASAGYSADGAEIARRAVLTPYDDAFNALGNAFEFAPLHLMQVLSPSLSRMGVWGGCATTIAGFDRRASRPALYTYPGNGASVYLSERAFEMPFVPGDFVGLPQGTTTGPHIYLMPHGAGPGQITSAAVTGPSGPVEIRTVDNATKGLEGYMAPGAIIIPVAPLAPGSYTVSATFVPSGGAALSRTWGFEAAAPRPATAPAATTGSSAITAVTGVVLRVDNPRPAGRSVRFRVLAGASLVGRRATVIMYRVVRRCAGGTCRDRRHGKRLRSVIGRLAARQTILAPRPARGRAIEVVVQTQPYESGGLSYAAGYAVSRWSPG